VVIELVLLFLILTWSIFFSYNWISIAYATLSLYGVDSSGMEPLSISTGRHEVPNWLFRAVRSFGFSQRSKGSE